MIVQCDTGACPRHFRLAQFTGLISLALNLGAQFHCPEHGHLDTWEMHSPLVGTEVTTASGDDDVFWPTPQETMEPHHALRAH